MPNIQTGAKRIPHDLSPVGFLAGHTGRLITITTPPVILRTSVELGRPAGVSALRLPGGGDCGHIRMSSGEVLGVAVVCNETIGQIGNVEHENENVGKSGKSRWRGKGPAVRGVTMNPFDHPHGGREGRSGPGRHPKTAWGKPPLRYRTRRHKNTKHMLVPRRPPKRKSKG